MKSFEKVIKNVISRKLQGLEKCNLEARFLTLESILTAPNYRVENFKFSRKISKIVVSRRNIKNMADKIPTPEGTLTAYHYWVANFKLGKINTDFKRKIDKKTFLTIAIYDIG